VEDVQVLLGQFARPNSPYVA
jgi:NADPH:quinone reductase-like Zn-dependent oxidoreductase